MTNFTDFDRYLAERNQETRTVRIFGRDCEVPLELPMSYVLKLIRSGTKASEDLELLGRMFAPADFEHITAQPAFTIGAMRELVQRIWLNDADDSGADEVTEDDLAVRGSRGTRPKKD